MTSPRPRVVARLAAVFVAIALIVGVGITTTVLGQQPAATATTVAASVGSDRCSPEWTSSPGGQLHFELTNVAVGSTEVYLQDPRSRAVYAEVEGIGPGGTATLDVVLGNGRYRFVCISDDADPVMGKTVAIRHVRKRSDLTPASVVVTRQDLDAPTTSYHAWVQSQLPLLQEQTRAVQGAVTSGDRAAAKRAWTRAHMTYETLGAAYGAFGDADSAINGTAEEDDPAADPDLTGFHKLGAQLWEGVPLASAAPVADQLARDVDSLAEAFPSSPIDSLDMGLRAHEILENTIEFELNGDEDGATGTELATISANLAGTKHALEPLRAILADRYARLDETERALDAASAAVDEYEHPDGTWTALSELPDGAREKLDAQMSALAELLAPVAAICDPRYPI